MRKKKRVVEEIWRRRLMIACQALRMHEKPLVDI
jgi:hypothetical protein